MLKTHLKNEMALLPGVYALKSTIDKRLYIGSTKCIKKRVTEHLTMLRKNRHHAIHLQKFFNKHGEASLSFEIIENCDIADLVTREQYWMDYTANRRSRRLLFNSQPNAGSPLGMKHSKLSLHLQKKKRDAKHDARMQEAYRHMARIEAIVMGRAGGKCECCSATESEDSLLWVTDAEDNNAWFNMTTENRLYLCQDCTTARASTRRKAKREASAAAKTALSVQ